MMVGTPMPDQSPIYCAAPHGSVLGPALFCMSPMPIEDIIFRHGLLTQQLATYAKQP